MKKQELTIKLKQIFKKHHLSNNHSKICAEYLIKAEVINAQSHGLARLKIYFESL